MERLVELLRGWWPLTGFLVAVGGLLLASARCAVAEIAIWISAIFYTPDKKARILKRTEWLSLIPEMTPAERIDHAGSLLWIAFKRAPRTLFILLVCPALSWLVLLVMRTLWFITVVPLLIVGVAYTSLPSLTPRFYLWIKRHGDDYDTAVFRVQREIEEGTREAKPLSRREFARIVGRFESVSAELGGGFRSHRVAREERSVMPVQLVSRVR